VTAHPAAPVSRLMSVLGIDTTAASSAVQFAGQPMEQAARLDSQAVREGAVLNVEDLAESMLAQSADVPGELEMELRLKLKTEQAKAPEKITYQFQKEDFTFCCVPIAPATYIPLTSIDTAPPGSVADTMHVSDSTTDNWFRGQPGNEKSLASTDSVGEEQPEPQL